MFRELLQALRRGVDSFRYFRHSYLPFSPWRDQIEAVIAGTRAAAAQYGIDAPVDRRRAYQLARMTIADRRGRHLPDLVPDAYQAFSPPSAATFHSGKRRYPAPAERLHALRSHPQTLAWLLTPSALSLQGWGNSLPGGIGVLAAGEHPKSEAVAARLAAEFGAGPATDRWAEVLAALAAGPLQVEQDPASDPHEEAA